MRRPLAAVPEDLAEHVLAGRTLSADHSAHGELATVLDDLIADGTTVHVVQSEGGRLRVLRLRLGETATLVVDDEGSHLWWSSHVPGLVWQLLGFDVHERPASAGDEGVRLRRRRLHDGAPAAGDEVARCTSFGPDDDGADPSLVVAERAAGSWLLGFEAFDDEIELLPASGDEVWQRLTWVLAGSGGADAEP